MKTLVEEIDTKYCTRFSHNVERENDGNTFLKSNYHPQETNTTSFGQQFFRWLGTKIWALIPDPLKSIDSLAAFKNQVKKVNFYNFLNIFKVWVNLKDSRNRLNNSM